MNYFANKIINKMRAEEHIEEVLKKYSKEIQFSIDNTTIYDEQDCFNLLQNDRSLTGDFDAVARFEKVTSVEAIFDTKSRNKRVAVLNFASFKHPGGMFLEGSYAQEEHLCHMSTLYPVLENFNSYYEYNRTIKNKGLYANRCIYSPDIIFINDKGKTKMCDVITLAAPNAGVAEKNGVPVSVIEDVMKERIRLIFEIATDKKVDILILGAYGCGVFRNDPYKTAESFARISAKYLCEVNYAIPDDKHYDIFTSLISNYLFNDAFKAVREINTIGGYKNEE